MVNKLRNFLSRFSWWRRYDKWQDEEFSINIGMYHIKTNNVTVELVILVLLLILASRILYFMIH